MVLRDVAVANACVKLCGQVFPRACQESLFHARCTQPLVANPATMTTEELKNKEVEVGAWRRLSACLQAGRSSAPFNNLCRRSRTRTTRRMRTPTTRLIWMTVSEAREPSRCQQQQRPGSSWLLNSGMQQGSHSPRCGKALASMDDAGVAGALITQVHGTGRARP